VRIDEAQISDLIGVLDGLRADFALAPLPGEPSCREDLHPFNPEAHLKEGEIFRYRPMGCPITHFARVLKNNRGIVTVHLVGPVHLLQGLPAPEDIGLCMVVAFEGVVSRGRRPEVGETVRFLPELLHDAKGALGSGGALRGNDGEDRGDRFEGVVGVDISYP
jgi:hypothetical protein